MVTDAAARLLRDQLRHEPPVLGWSPRPPAAILRASRLERYRERQLERLAERRPRVHAQVMAVRRSSLRFWDRVMPRQRVLAVTVAVLGLTLFDALATIVLVGTGVAEEANPLLADLIEQIGLTAAMGVRIVVGAGLTLVLAWLSTWRREARPVLAFVAFVLSAVACLHVVGILWSFG